MAAAGGSFAKIAAALRAQALRLPEAVEDTPWGHRVAKVRGKIFVFCDGSPEAFTVTVKLPASRDAALALPFTEPTGYGLGKSGWITARFEKGADVPVPLIEEWILESYRAVAPKRLAAGLSAPMPAVKAKAVKKVAPAKKKPVARRARK